jgi:hypothetical protein
VPPTERRVYRHTPWLIVTTVVTALVVAMAVPLVGNAIRHPGLDKVLATTAALALMAGFVAFLLANWRIRTVVDGTGVTQHWISRTFHIPYEDITDLEPDQAGGRWFLRVFCGDRTFEVIPCHSAYLLGFPGGGSPQPPEALVAAHADIAARWSRATT